MELFNTNGHPVPASQVVEQPSAKGLGKYRHTDPCGRCGGQGGSTGWPGYTCYSCLGSGKDLPKVSRCYTAEAYAKLEERRQAKADKRAAEIKAAQDAARAKFAKWLATQPAAQWLLNDRSDDSGFLGSIRGELLGNRILTDRQLAALVRVKDKIAQREAERDQLIASSAPVGEVGERRDFNLKLTTVRSIETQYGYSYLHVMEDIAGNAIKYFGSARLGDEGETLTVKATVKAHEAYRGLMQTVVSRPKVLS